MFSSHRPFSYVVFSSEKYQTRNGNFVNKRLTTLLYARGNVDYYIRYCNNRFGRSWLYFNQYENGVFSKRVYNPLIS